jgi:hypothetical protein
MHSYQAKGTQREHAYMRDKIRPMSKMMGDMSGIKMNKQDFYDDRGRTREK